MTNDDKNMAALRRIVSAMDDVAEEYGETRTLDAAIIANVFIFSASDFTLDKYLAAITHAWAAVAAKDVTHTSGPRAAA